ncbi:MAG TPA: type II CAAX endopeptidase family protein [Saprospiraceae bacterium]|nr:type II CAAX endopeptidase family protein [Saprospiraceae bacterium]
MNFTILDHIFFFIIGIVLPALSLIRGKVDMEILDFKSEDKKRFYYANGGILWIGAIVVFILWVLAGRPFSSMGLQWPVTDGLVVIFVLVFLILYFIEMVAETKNIKNFDELLKSAAFLPRNKTEFTHFSFLAFSAGVCEEIVYRGFLVTYLYFMINDPVWSYHVAVVLPALIFGAVHIYQGYKPALKITVMSLLLGTIFIFSQSLLIVVILHIGIDLIGGVIGMNLFNKMEELDNEESQGDEELP